MFTVDFYKRFHKSKTNIYCCSQKYNYERKTVKYPKLQLRIRLARVVFFIRKLKTCTTSALVLNAYYGFFHVHLTHGVTLWGNSAGAKKVFL